MITEEFVQQIAAEGAKGRVLAVAAVNLDRGESIAFSLTAIASGARSCGEGVSAGECIINAVLAAAAIPVAFPPVFINGDLFVDGGLRQHAFLLNLTDGVLRSPTTALRLSSMPGTDLYLPAPNTPPDDSTALSLTLIANTDFQIGLNCTRNGFLDIGQRSATIATDALSIGSFYRLLSETARRNGNSIRYTFADPSQTGCTLHQYASGITDIFDNMYMRCLFSAGCTLAANGDSLWHVDPNDLPQSPTLPRARLNVSQLDRSAPPVCSTNS